jgi:hypothetical protein
MPTTKVLVVSEKNYASYWDVNIGIPTNWKLYVRDINTLEDAYKMAGYSFAVIVYDKEVPKKVKERLQAMIRYAN